jgi:hypothetical protein
MIAAVAWAQEAPPPPFRSGETLNFDISWRIFGAGKARMTVSEEHASPAPKWSAVVEAYSTGFVSKLYKVEDVFQSVFLADTGCTEHLVKTIREGRRRRLVRIDFVADRGVASLRETDLARNELVRQAENPIPPCAYDVVSALYHVRGRKLDVGKPFQIPINDGGRTILVDVEVQAREELRTPAGVFQTIRLEPHVFGGMLFRRSGRMQVWLADDATRRLVQVKAKLVFGTITATLTGVENRAASGN